MGDHAKQIDMQRQVAVTQAQRAVEADSPSPYYAMLLIEDPFGY
jgi:hypothetical protein